MNKPVCCDNGPTVFILFRSHALPLSLVLCCTTVKHGFTFSLFPLRFNLCDLEFVCPLQIHPGLGCHTKIVRQS